MRSMMEQKFVQRYIDKINDLYNMEELIRVGKKVSAWHRKIHISDELFSDILNAYYTRLWYLESDGSI